MILKNLWSALLICLLFLVPQAGLAQTPSTKTSPPPTSRPTTPAGPQKSTEITPLGLTMLTDISALTRNILDLQHIGFAKEAQLLYSQFLSQAQRYYPTLKSARFHQLLPLLPIMLKPLGVHFTRPCGVMAWRYQSRFIPVFVLSVNPNTLLKNLTLAGLNPTIKHLKHARIISIGQTTGSLLGVVIGDKLYFSLPHIPKRRGLRDQNELKALYEQIALLDDPIHALLKSAGFPNLLRDLETGKTDHFAVIPDSKAFNFLPQAQLISKVLSSLSFSYSLKNGLKTHLNLRGPGFFRHFLKVLTPPTHTQSWYPETPASTAWASQGFLSFDALMNLLKQLPQSGLIPPQLSSKLGMGIAMVNIQAATFGIDLQLLQKNFTGRIMTGFLWQPQMASRLAQWRRGNGFNGHMRGTFAALGFKDQKGPLKFIEMLQNIKKNLDQMFPKKTAQIQLLTSKAHPQHLQLILPQLAPLYITAKKDRLYFFGDQWTHDQFKQVWQHKAPALQQSTGLPQGIGQFAWIKPEILKQLAAVFVPHRAAPRFAPWLSRIQNLAFRSKIHANQLSSSIHISLTQQPTTPTTQKSTAPTPLPKETGQSFTQTALIISFGALPLSSLPIGILAGVAIPAFVKFTRKSKSTEALVNLRSISSGAVLYYHSDHIDKKGTPIVPRFPCSGKGWICTPSQLPCKNGKKTYNPTPQRWTSNACWKQLGFSISGKHFYRYCYKSEGIGKNSTFTVRAQGDLDCDGKTSLFESSSQVVDGVIKRGRLQVMNRTE